MRVLHLYAGNLYGGIETMLATVVRHAHAVPELQHEFGLSIRGRLWEELSSTGAEVHDLGPVRFSRPWSVMAARRNLAALLRERPFDAVITHACWPHAVFASAVRRFERVQLINWVHDALKGEHWLDRRAARTPPERVIANSHYTAAKVGNVFPTAECEVIYCPVERRIPEDPVTVRREVRAELGATEDETVIVQVSRMEAWKGHQLHLDALGKLRKLPDWKAWFVGGPQRPAERAYFESLQQTAQQLGVADRVHFLGQRSDVPRLLAAADIFCQPNTGPEPFGIVFVEALYAGLPVITTNCGGGAEIVTKKCGVLTQPGDAAALTAGLESLVVDKQRRKTLATAAPDRAQSLCDPKNQLGQLYASLSAAKGVLC